MLELKYGAIVKHNDQLGELVTRDEKFYFHPVKYGNYYCSNLDEVTEKNVQETTHNEKVEYLKQEFPWGEIIKVYNIGEYVIFEYINGYDLEREGKTVIAFHAYMNYRNLSYSYNSLDSCLIGTIARKYDGANSQAAKFFERMVKME